MTRSHFAATPYYLAADRSHNYTRQRDSNGHEVSVNNGTDFDPGITMPNGGWNAPLPDLVSYLAFLTESSHGDPATQRLYDAVLRHSTLTEMWKPLYPTVHDGSEVEKIRSACLSFPFAAGRRRLSGIRGTKRGFRAFMFLNPDTGAAVAAAFNTDRDLSANEHPSKYQCIRDGALQLLE